MQAMPLADTRLMNSGSEFNPERISHLKALGIRNLLRLEEIGISRELHLSLADEFGREYLFKLLSTEHWNAPNVFKLTSAVENLAKEIKRAEYSGTDDNPYPTDDSNSS